MIIYITGFMAAGKSHWGKIWAEELGYHFVDMDRTIEEELGLKVAEIFSKKGEEFFRQKEADVLRSITGKKIIVATGGGVPVFHENMDWMNRHGLTVYLKANPTTVLNNISSDKSSRPLFDNVPPERAMDFIREKLEERNPWYEKAQVHLQAENVNKNSLDAYINHE